MQICAVVAISQALGDTVGQVVFRKETPSARIGNTVCRTYDAAERTIFFDSFFAGIVNQKIFVGRPSETLFGYTLQNCFFAECGRVEGDYVISCQGGT